MENKVPYIHDTQVHNLQAPKEIVPILIKMFSPKSVVDVGCGLGTFLRVFKENGITNILGIDGPWVDKTLLFENISPVFFLETNLNEELHLAKKFDMALCLEVAEHLHKDNANNIVSTLTNLSDVIVFSAAIPSQGGQNHINEQWPTYWLNLFSQHGYNEYDILRPIFWNRDDIFFWYKQTMFVLVKEGSSAETLVKKVSESVPKTIYSIVHPDLYLTKVKENADAQNQIIKYEEELKKILSGERGLRFYMRLIKKHIIKR